MTGAKILNDFNTEPRGTARYRQQLLSLVSLEASAAKSLDIADALRVKGIAHRKLCEMKKPSHLPRGSP